MYMESYNLHDCKVYTVKKHISHKNSAMQVSVFALSSTTVRLEIKKKKSKPAFACTIRKKSGKIENSINIYSWGGFKPIYR